MSGLSYAGSGIDIHDTDAAKREMAKSLETKDPRVLNRIGAFASLFRADFPGVERPVLVMKTEEPGSKQLLAFQEGRIEGICHDMINHLVNDIAVMGAAPLMVQDAIITGAVDKAVITRLVAGMAEACANNECSLVGGETSIQPGVLEGGRFILPSSVVGVVDESRVVDGSAIREGDAVLAVASNGLHTNGYTLVRKLMEAEPSILAERIGDKAFMEAILEPHLAYYPLIKRLMAGFELRGMAHITGGGIRDNLKRVIPQNLDALIDLSRIEPLPLFELIRARGRIEEAEMLRTFNCGVGLCLVARAQDARAIEAEAARAGYRAYKIGGIESGGTGDVRFEGKLR